jgi:hypothetical protein
MRRTLFINGLEEINGDLPEADFWGSEGRIATKAFRKRGFSFSLTTKPQAQQPERDVPSVGMFRVPQSVNCSVRRLFGYSLLFCPFLRTK